MFKTGNYVLVLNSFNTIHSSDLLFKIRGKVGEYWFDLEYGGMIDSRVLNSSGLYYHYYIIKLTPKQVKFWKNK